MGQYGLRNDEGSIYHYNFFLGAMSGVGIWLSASVVSPSSIASLLRVFYWAWFTEWLVFVTEVVLILIYFLTWKNSNKSLKAKLKHIKFGWFLSIFSWITMAIIVSILGFMMDPGNWKTHHSLINGFTNPIYLPQLLFSYTHSHVDRRHIWIFTHHHFYKKEY